MKRRKCMAGGGILAAGVSQRPESEPKTAAGGYARGGIIPVLGLGSGTSDSIPVVLAGHKVKVSNGEGVAVLPKKTMDTPGAVAAVEDLIEQTNGKPAAPMVDGGRYAAGALPTEDGLPKILSTIPEGGILRTQQGRQQAAQAIANAPSIGSPLTIGGGQPAPTAPSIYAPAYAAFRQGLSGEGLRPEVGITGPRAFPQQASFSNEGSGSAILANNLAVRAATVPVAVAPAVPNTAPSPAAATAAQAGVPAPSAVEQPAKFPQPNDPVPSGTGFIRNNRTGAVTPVVGASIVSPALQQSVSTPESMGVMQAIHPTAQPTDTNRYRQTAENILLDESRGPGGGVAARMLMGLAGRAAGMDNDAARTANETAAVAARAQQAAAELASTDYYRRASLGIHGREQTMREQELADKRQEMAAQLAARAGIADAIESGDEAKIKKAQAKGIAAGVLKQPDVQKDLYSYHTTALGDQARMNKMTGETHVLDRETNTWRPVIEEKPYTVSVGMPVKADDGAYTFQGKHVTVKSGKVAEVR